MEPKRLTVIVDKDDHLRAQKKMLDEFGEANFTKLIGDYLREYADGTGSVSSSGQNKKTVFDELLEVDPESAEELVQLMKSRIKKAIARKNAAPIPTIPEKAPGARVETRSKKRA